jgi:hypothetical protein
MLEHVPLDRIGAFHLNDSKRELGSRVDRHEHIGKGHIGIDAFGFLLNDERFAGVPKVLETPKPTEFEADIENLTLLRSLIGKATGERREAKSRLDGRPEARGRRLKQAEGRSEVKGQRSKQAASAAKVERAIGDKARGDQQVKKSAVGKPAKKKPVAKTSAAKKGAAKKPRRGAAKDR